MFLAKVKVLFLRYEFVSSLIFSNFIVVTYVHPWLIAFLTKAIQERKKWDEFQSINKMRQKTIIQVMGTLFTIIENVSFPLWCTLTVWSESTVYLLSSYNCTLFNPPKMVNLSEVYITIWQLYEMKILMSLFL